MENVRNIVRLKDVPSNIIEEAIIIFKENKKAKNFEFSNKFNKNSEEKEDDRAYVVKEAELIISDYLRQSEEIDTSSNKKVNKWKWVSACLGILLFVSIIF